LGKFGEFKDFGQNTVKNLQTDRRCDILFFAVCKKNKKAPYTVVLELAGLSTHYA
jgi:hypothetical protein